MKKILFLLTFLVLLVVAVGCSEFTIDRDGNNLTDPPPNNPIVNDDLAPKNDDTNPNLTDDDEDPLSSNDEPPTNSMFEYEVIAPYPQTQSVHFFNTFEEFEEFAKDNSQLKYYQKINGDYDEEYFLTHDLIIYYGYETHYLKKQTIASVVYIDGVISINVNVNTPEVIPSVMAPIYFFYPISIEKVPYLEKIIFSYSYKFPYDKFDLKSDDVDKLIERLTEPHFGITIQIEFVDNDDDFVNEQLDILKTQFSGKFSKYYNLHYIEYDEIPLEELNELILIAENPEFKWIFIKVKN